MDQPIKHLDLQNSDCKKCPLFELRDRVINGFGNLDAKIMIVADSPSFDENDSGRGFSGTVGKELDRLLGKLGLHRSQVYLTYINRCFGKLHGNRSRPPTYQETLACMPYIEQEIALIKPTVIIPLGNGALAPFLGKKKATISDYRGKEVWSEKYNCKIIPTYSPSMILRNPNLEQTVIQDLRRAYESSKYVELTKYEEGNYITINSIEQFDSFFERIMQQEVVAWDIETSGFDWQNDKLLCVSFSWKKGTAVILPITKWTGIEKERVEIKSKKVTRKGVSSFKQVEELVRYTEDSYHDWWGENQQYVMDKLRTILESDISWVLQNGKFDYKFFIQMGWKVKPAKHDPMLMHYLLHETAKGQHGLKEMALHYTNKGDYDKELEDWFCANGMKEDDSRNYARVPTELLFKYAGADSDVTLQLKEIFLPLLEQEGMLDIYHKLIMPLSYTLTIAEFEGFRIDRNALEKTRIDMEAEILILETELKKLTGDINLDSPKQLCKLLFEDLKLPIVKTTDKGAPSTDEEAMTMLKDKHEIPMKIVEYRGLAKLLSTYVLGILERLDASSRLHTKFNIPGTDTGRLSSSDPNLQNIPGGDKRIKKAFVVEPGNILVEADEGQNEFRWWGILSNDPQLVKDLNDGVDIHRFMAALTNGIPIDQVTDKQRQAAKSIVFGLMFSMGIDKLSKDNNVTTQYAENVKNTFFARYPMAKKWRYDIVKEGKRNGFVRSRFGRVRHLTGINSPDNKVSYPFEQAAINAPIQGAASDYVSNSANRIIIRFKEEGLHGKLRNLVHDAIYMEIPRSELERSMKIMDEEMTRRILNIQVPLIAEFKIGKRWGRMHKVKHLPVVKNDQIAVAI